MAVGVGGRFAAEPLLLSLRSKLRGIEPDEIKYRPLMAALMKLVRTEYFSLIFCGDTSGSVPYTFLNPLGAS